MGTIESKQRGKKMKAFYKTETGQIVKVFDEGDDWQVIDGDVELWFSQWSRDRKGSLVSAVTGFLIYQYSEQFQSERLVVC